MERNKKSFLINNVKVFWFESNDNDDDDDYEFVNWIRPLLKKIVFLFWIAKQNKFFWNQVFNLNENWRESNWIKHNHY